jgi:pimeloyl-ACP methyl ester carboxylesterase
LSAAPGPAATVSTPDGARLAVHHLGGEGAPLVLVHATSFHAAVWQPLVAHVADRFRGVAFDLRGHGDSVAPPGWDHDWHGLAVDALAVVDGLGLERPLAVGHSSGATALLLAEEARPGTFSGIYCYEPVVVAEESPLGRDRDSWMAARARRRRDVFASRGEAEQAYAAKPPFSRFDAAALHAYVAHGFEDVADDGVRLKCRPATEASLAEMATAHDCFPRLGDVRCPVTIAYGSETDAIGPALLAAVTARLPSTSTEVLAGLTHYGPLEDPEAVAASIRRSLHV